MVLCKGAYHPSLGAVSTYILEMLNLGPPVAHLLLVVGVFLEMGVHPRPYPGYVDQSAKAAR